MRSKFYRVFRQETVVWSVLGKHFLVTALSYNHWMRTVLQRYWSSYSIIGTELSFISLQDAKYALISVKFCTNWGLKWCFLWCPFAKWFTSHGKSPFSVLVLIKSTEKRSPHMIHFTKILSAMESERNNLNKVSLLEVV